MTDIRNYDRSADFASHQNEFNSCLNIINRYCDIKDKFVLDVGSGTGGHAGFLLNSGCKKLIGIDLHDYETLWSGNFKNLLVEQYRSNGVPFDAAKCQFISMNAEEMLFKDKLFDLVVTINTFEHLGDPKKALLEIHRVLKPGGYTFIQFSPIFYCDTGGHMFDFISEPWGHLIHPHDEYVRLLEQAGTPKDVVNDYLYGLNRLPRSYFDDLFGGVVKNHLFEKMVGYDWSGVLNNAHLEHPNFSRLLLKHSREDLLFRGMNILLKKLPD